MLYAILDADAVVLLITPVMRVMFCNVGTMSKITFQGSIVQTVFGPVQQNKDDAKEGLCVMPLNELRKKETIILCLCLVFNICILQHFVLWYH